MLKAVFFDLDGTLLPMSEDGFVKVYFKLLYEKVKFKGYYQEAKLYKDIYTGVKVMMMNDGTKTNEEAFWDYFKKEYGDKVLDDKPIFEDFYQNEFKQAKIACEENPEARKIVDFVKNSGLKCVLSTNPIFPYVGTKTRMEFVGLNPEDFDFVTVYENSSYSKPNPMYFKDILTKLNLKPEEVVLFGNNVTEDYECAKKAGINCVLVGNYIIGDLGNIKHIAMNEVISTIQETLKNN